MTSRIGPGLGLERCSARSLDMRESMAGTASTVANWIMLEHPGPWGRDALATSRFPDDVGRRLRGLASTLEVRVVLIRRHGRHTAGQGIDCYFAHTGPGKPWLEHVRLEHVAGLFDLDLSPLGRGERPEGGRAEAEPLLLACTHGRRDPCCSEKGRPLALALAQAFADRSWETSHIGGDRFAGNLVCFPHGMYFGRLGPEEGVSAANAYRDGRIDLPYYRGRSCYGFAVQAAEMFLRTRTGQAGVDDLRLVGVRRPERGEIEATFAVPGGATHAVTVRRKPADEARRLTCHSTDPVRPPTYRLVGVEASRP
ncbi:MAG TPA: sucrase ferredoxin [Actinomycetota bacterium]